MCLQLLGIFLIFYAIVNGQKQACQAFEPLMHADPRK
jgi:hypothetical protein